MRTLHVACGLILAVVLVWLSGCLPDEMPGSSPDGNTIALVTTAPSEDATLWTYDLKTKKAVAHRLPDRWQLTNARWFGDQLWVGCQREEGELKDPKTGQVLINQRTGKPMQDTKSMWTRFDPAKDAFVADAPRLNPFTFVDSPFLAARDGRAVLLSPVIPTEGDDSGPETTKYDVFSLPDLKKISTDEMGRVMSAGKLWRVHTIEDERSAEVARLEFFDAKGNKACEILPEQITPATHRGNASFPMYARISRDESVIALLFSTETVFRRNPRKYTFGVFDTKTGKLVWSGGTDSLFGTPLVTAKAVWTLEYIDAGARPTDAVVEAPGPNDPPADKFVLVRHSPGDKGDEAKREEICRYELAPGQTVGQFAPSPDGASFYVAVNGDHPRLLIVPIREKLVPKDIVHIDLKAAAKP